MNLYPELVQALAEASPFVLVVIIAGAALIGMTIFIVRGVTPAIGRIIEQQTEAAKKQVEQHDDIVSAWRSLLSEQNRINAQLSDALKRELDEERQERVAMEVDLRKHIAELQGEIDEKTRQLDEAKTRIGELEKQLEIVQGDRDKLQQERDELKRKVDQLTHDVERLRSELKKYKNGHSDKRASGGNGVRPTSGNPDTDCKPGCNGDCQRDGDSQPAHKPDTKPDGDGQPDGNTK